MKKSENFEFSLITYSVTIKVNWDIKDWANRAQYALDSRVMTDMIPIMPKQTGTFINTTQLMSQSVAGSGIVYAGAPPMGHYLYIGLTMVDEVTGSPWARKAAKKVYVSEYSGKTNASAKLALSRHANPGADPKWFEVAKKRHLNEWVKIVGNAFRENK